MWEGSVLVGQLLALPEGSAVGWMTKEISINFWQKKFSVIFKASRKSLRPPLPSQHSMLRVK
jgi:hypothetical protein